jgi:hypothetical protein
MKAPHAIVFSARGTRRGAYLRAAHLSLALQQQKQNRLLLLLLLL